MKLFVSNCLASLFICMAAFEAVNCHPDTTHLPPTSERPPFQDCGICPTIVQNIRNAVKKNPTAERVQLVFNANCYPSNRVIDPKAIITGHKCEKYRPHMEQCAPLIANFNIAANHICEIFDECMMVYP
ncbi:uncharacterized protein LOC129578498 [Sitodiplosis mosellana]|uniref:uncharacterized protein LOC129578498 n=1 Tax=Sitodiplosis mosellana TaxID=263140 RepID=UPI002444E81A|nr:uncharacterized protein LOC129578498 [Sitodiplosis mosellana]